MFHGAVKSIIFRFKNGIQIAGESGSTLSLTGLSLNDAGGYRCRANTESKAIYSSEAILTVKGKSDRVSQPSNTYKLTLKL